MTYYQQEIIKIRSHHFPHEYQNSRMIDAKHFIENRASYNLQLEDMTGSAFFSKFHFIGFSKNAMVERRINISQQSQ